uniref:Lipid-binding serum glycoprotein C-terminal domain-containing protein n=1 Tax=Falco tinnunculus TaxID=100819 RepID=A0A8C4XJF2_FALTI
LGTTNATAPPGTSMVNLLAPSILLSLLVPTHSLRSPDCGGILTPSGLSYLAEVSKPHTEAVLRQNLMAPTVPDLFLSSPKPSKNQIDSVEVSKLSLSLIPDTGLQLSIDVDLGITPEPKLPARAMGCMLSMLINPPPSLLCTRGSPPSAQLSFPASLLGKPRCFPDPTCCHCSLPVSEHLSARFAAQFPITPSCQVQYLPLAAPVFSEQGITISLQTTFQVAGMAIPLPVSPVPFSMPEPASSSSSHLTLAFSEHFYTSLFFALEMAGSFNMTIPSPLTTATMAQKISQVGSLFQEDVPVVLQAVFRSSPQVVLEEGKAALKLFLTIHVGAGLPAFQSFLSVNVDMSAGLLLSVVDTRMMISAASSKGRGSLWQVALLEELFLPTIREEVPAQMNVVLSEGIFLPHISSFTYTDVNVIIHKVRNETFKLLPAMFDLKRTWEQRLPPGSRTNRTLLPKPC